jgi:hypothetical protein
MPLDDRISIDRDGNFRHDGAEITHPGTIALFHRSLEKTADGYRLRVGRESCPVVVEDAPLVVRSIEATPAAVHLLLSDGATEALDPATLRQGPDHVLYCAARGGEFPARFSRAAYYALAALLVPEDDGGFALVVGDRSYHIVPSA